MFSRVLLKINEYFDVGSRTYFQEVWPTVLLTILLNTQTPLSCGIGPHQTPVVEARTELRVNHDIEPQSMMGCVSLQD